MLKFTLTGRIYGILSKLDPVLDPAKTRPYEKTGSCGKTRPQEKSLFKKLKSTLIICHCAFYVSIVAVLKTHV